MSELFISIMILVAEAAGVILLLLVLIMTLIGVRIIGLKSELQ